MTVLLVTQTLQSTQSPKIVSSSAQLPNTKTCLLILKTKIVRIAIIRAWNV
jgi:hypothetical protein